MINAYAGPPKTRRFCGFLMTQRNLESTIFPLKPNVERVWVGSWLWDRFASSSFNGQRNNSNQKRTLEQKSRSANIVVKKAIMF